MRVGVRDFSDRMSLRTKLIIGLLALVIAAVAAISISSVWVLRSYLVSQDDAQLQTLYSSLINNWPPDHPPGYAYRVGASNIFAGIQESGTTLSPAGSEDGLPNSGYSQSVPAVPSSELWAFANRGKLVTVRAQSGSHTWRVIAGPIQYQAPTSTGGIEQVTGTLIVGADLGDINATIGSLAVTVLIIGLIVVCILALAIVMVVRANLRPLVEIEETAGEIADGHLNRRVPERDPRTEIGRLGRSLNTMLSQIETAFHKQEESEAAAHRSEERMRRFVADASHELRTPVTAIRGFAEYYRQRGGLVRRWDRDQEAAQAAILVMGDEARLRQVIGNLMSNALTHTPDGTPIEISLSTGTLDPQAGDHSPAVLLDVTDHGPGMTPEQARRVFERFYRADQARTRTAGGRTTGGSGLGLAIVRALVAAQGGVTSVRTVEGQGATFRIALPLAPEAMGHPDDADLADDPELDDEVDGTKAARAADRA